MSKRLALLLAVSILSGCGSANAPLTLPTLPPPPAESVVACAPLPVMFATAGAAVAWVADVSALYVACNEKRRVAVEAWPRG